MENDAFINSVTIRNRMKTSKGCLLMVARREQRKLRKVARFRELCSDERVFLVDCSLFYHDPQMIPYEAFRESVLRYFDIDF